MTNILNIELKLQLKIIKCKLNHFNHSSNNLQIFLHQRTNKIEKTVKIIEYFTLAKIIN